MRKGIKYVLISFSFIALIFSLSSCGIPSYYIPSSNYVSFSTNGSEVNVKADLSKLTSSGVSATTASTYPKVALYYQIIPNGQSKSGFDDVLSNFKTLYLSDKNVNRLPVGKLSYKKEYKDTSLNFTSEYGIYQFTSQDELESYIANVSDAIKVGDVLNWKLGFKLVDGNILLTINDSTSAVVLERFNGNKFDVPLSDFFSACRDSAEIPLQFRDNTIKCTIRIHIVVSTEFTNYNNIYNRIISSPLEIEID